MIFKFIPLSYWKSEHCSALLSMLFLSCLQYSCSNLSTSNFHFVSSISSFCLFIETVSCDAIRFVHYAKLETRTDFLTISFASEWDFNWIPSSLECMPSLTSVAIPRLKQEFLHWWNLRGQFQNNSIILLENISVFFVGIWWNKKNRRLRK